MCVCVVCIQMGGILLKSYLVCVRVYACMRGMYTDGTELLQTPSHRKRFQLKPCSNFDVCVLSLSRSLSLSLSLARSLSLCGMYNDGREYSEGSVKSFQLYLLFPQEQIKDIIITLQGFLLVSGTEEPNLKKKLSHRAECPGNYFSKSSKLCLYIGNVLW